MKGKAITVGREVYGGRTVTEANAKALAHLAKFNDGRYCNPHAVTVPTPDGNLVGIVFRDHSGDWSYTLHWPHKDAKINKGTSSVHMHPGWTYEDACDAMGYHLAQCAFGCITLEEAQSLVPSSKHSELRAWWVFQTAYANAKKQGKTNEEAWQLAGATAP